MTNHDDYFEYLKQRSFIGKIYRNWLLYPKLSACLNDTVLDFGCGIGDFLVFRPDAVGVDINPHNVEYCRSLGLSAELIQHGRMPFDNNSFGSAVMDNVLEHVPAGEVDTVLREVLRVLVPGGRLLIGVPGRKGYASDADHQCFYAEPELIQLLAGHDCRVEKVFYMPVHLSWLEDRLSQYCLYALFRTPEAGP